MTRERFLLELAVHVKLASEAIVAAATNLAALRPDAADESAEAWTRTMDDLELMNVELALMERIVRTAARGTNAPARTRTVSRVNRRAV